jgi:activator of HSP90 ATPase
MGRIIQQAVLFDSVTEQELYDTFTDEKLLAAAIGAPARIVRKPGGVFSIFGDSHVRGRTLLLNSPGMVVQEWRAAIWKPGDPDSVLVLEFGPTDSGARIDLIQVGVPEHAVDTIDAGWHLQYWEPWKAHFNPRAVPAKGKR